MAEEEWISGNIALTVKGVPLEFEMTVPAKPVKPHRLLPIFHQMTNSMVQTGVEVIEARGEKISCKAHCGACCRQAVPISEMEIYQIAELVEAMPEPRRTEIKERFAKAAEHFNRIGWYDRYIENQRTALTKEADAAIREGIDIALEYFRQGIPCPFLEDESCSIHPDRPVACREYLVTSPAEDCANLSPKTIKGVELLLKPSLALKDVARSANYEHYGVPILSRALELAEKYPESFEEKTGPEWMREFFTKLSKDNMPKDEPAAAI